MKRVFYKATATCMICCAIIISCNKKAPEMPGGGNGQNSGSNNNSDSTITGKDPSTAATIGFFLNNWAPKNISDPAYTETAKPSTASTTTVTIDHANIITKVSKYLFGNNSNPYMGQMVDQPKLIKYIKYLSPNIIRGPGGSISDVYFWNQSSAPPSDVPDSLYGSNGNQLSAGYWYGENTANWTLSLNNYYAMLQQTASTGMITVNYAYARYGTGAYPVETAAHLAADWVRHDKGRTKYWEIGNEDNGNWEASYEIDTSKNKDEQPTIITGKLYGQQFKIFADSMRAAAQQTSATIYIGAQLLEAPATSRQNATDKTWNEGVLTEAGKDADFFIVHDYFTPYNTNSSAGDILETASSIPSDVISYLNQQMSQYGVPVKPIALTEWNIRASGAMQNISNIAGVHAAITLGELIKNKFGEASRWDLANGWSNGDDQGMFNIGDEPGGIPKWNPRPAFYYMYYFQKYFGDRMLASSEEGDNDIISYASSFSSGQTGVVIINKGSSSKVVKIIAENFAAGSRYYWYTLTGGDDTFSPKLFINGNGPSDIAGGPDNYEDIKAFSAATEGGVVIKAPAYSVSFVIINKKE